MSSSSDDERPNFQSKINFANFNVGARKQPKPNAKNNLAKAAKKQLGGVAGKSSKKGARFPELYQRHSMISQSSSRQSGESLTASSSDEDDVGSSNRLFEANRSFGNSSPSQYGGKSRGGTNLPSFDFNNVVRGQLMEGEGEDDDDDMGDEGEEENQLDPRFYETDSSDDESALGVGAQMAPLTSRKSSIRSKSSLGHNRATYPDDSPDSRGSVNHFGGAADAGGVFESPLHPDMYPDEHDIVDQDATSLVSGGSQERPTGLKSILRKMSLVDSHPSDEYSMGASLGHSLGQPSRSDTFLGRVLSFSQDHGLGGGGLVPGGSRSERYPNRLQHIDEESEIGLDPEDPNYEDTIELKKMDFAKLSEEAHNLIAGHVPEMTVNRAGEQHGVDLLAETEGVGPVEGASSSTDSVREEKKSTNQLQGPGENPVDTSNGAEPQDDSHHSSFLAPNPDLYLRGEGQADDPDDYMMLDEDMGDGYVAPPKKVHAGVLSSLLKLYANPQEAKSSSTFGTSAATTLADDFDQEESVHHSHKPDFGKLKTGFKKLGKGKRGHQYKSSTDEGVRFPDGDVESISSTASHYIGEDAQNLPSFQNAKPRAPKRVTVKATKLAAKKLKGQKKFDQQLRITVHIADILQRQRFILRMCKALMLYGAPTHRLEEYMTMTSRVLEIDGQFIYFPGCMIVSFGDAATRTSEVHLVRCAQGLNLSKLSDTHKIYKSVIHDLTGVEAAAVKLEDLLSKKNLYNPWLCVFFYGLGSSMVTPFAFGGGWLDIPVSFAVGLCVGYLQFFVSSMSNLYSSVFEVTASIVVSFISRGIGSIHGGKIFCFSAIAQGSLALILPGYIILCGSLELQSRNIVAGSVRMFYAIIYLLFLGFGITLGAALYGWVDKNSISESTCPADHGIDARFRILFVPMFLLALGLINQARWRQVPVMIIIASVGYIGTYFAGKHFSLVTEFTAAIGAFIVGILGNMYLRIWKGMAVSAMLPAIFVQVPSGIASQSSLLTGIDTANQITNGSTKTVDAASSAGSLLFGAAMVEVSIGISVGLFAAALVVYPFGKKRTGLFTL